MRRPSGFDGEPSEGIDAPADAASGGDLDPVSPMSREVDRPRAPRRTPREPDPVREAEKRVKRAQRSMRRHERRERLRFSVAARRRRRNLLIAGGVVVALALAVAVAVFTPLMDVRTVRVVGASKETEPEIAQSLSAIKGRPLALVGDDDVRASLADFPSVQRYSIELLPPHTVKVTIEERVAVLSIKEGKKYTSYDAAGVPLGTASKREKGVPLAKSTVRQVGSKVFASAASVVREMSPKLRKKLEAVSATSVDDIRLKLKSGVTVFWGGEADSDKKSLELLTILKSLGDRQVTKIDVSSVDAPVFQ